MCRYAMTNYKPHYACFQCRKTFKRRLANDILRNNDISKDQKSAKCPDCGSLMANMGLDFESPKKKDSKAWEHTYKLYKVGITFHSCGCSGPGYIPSNQEDLISHFIKIKTKYLEHQKFWARRKGNPETQSEIAKDKHHNHNFLKSIPNKIKKGTKNKPIYNALQAQKYWNARVTEVEEKIEYLMQKHPSTKKAQY